MSSSDEEMIKRAVISGAAHALKYKEKNRAASDSEIMQKIVDELREITKEIDRE
ncbi:MAG: hypothetical protein PHH00_01655 [Candidatus Nanoarchaeia archaeon]|nr:hypothetical protein [Candidatus Nanoarchaeia archaeon]